MAILLSLLAPLPAWVLAGCGDGQAATRGASFDQERAWKHLEALVDLGPRAPGSPGIEKARDYLEARLSECGLEPVRESFTAETPRGPLEMVNVYADLPAREDPAREESAGIIVLCTHYDTKIFDDFVGPIIAAFGTEAQHGAGHSLVFCQLCDRQKLGRGDVGVIGRVATARHKVAYRESRDALTNLDNLPSA